MGAAVPAVEPAEEPSAESLLTSFGSLDAAERRRHASVLNYWLSLRAGKDFPPIRDLDPLELSDAAPSSLLLELSGGGEDAEIRHLGEALKPHGGVAKVSEATRASLLSAIASKLGIVAISRNFLAFEDEIEFDGRQQRCWITLLPFGSTGAWVDFVYGFVSIDPATAEEVVEAEAEIAGEPVADAAEPQLEEEPASAESPREEVDEVVAEAEPQPEPELIADPEPELATEQAEEEAGDDKRPGFSKLLDKIAGASGFYSSHARVEPSLPPLELIEEKPAPEPEPEAVSELPAPKAIDPAGLPEPEFETLDLTEEAYEAEEPLELAEEISEPEPEPLELVQDVAPTEPAPVAELPTPAMEGSLQSKLSEVRAKADEARQAKLRAEAALHEGLAAAYDFALDAESSPEEYLKLVEAQGLKIQLRAPMKPVVKLAFDGSADEATIRDLEAVLAWALKHELPRGTLAERIQEAGGIEPLLKDAA